jgi:hypothetical protein
MSGKMCSKNENESQRKLITKAPTSPAEEEEEERDKKRKQMPSKE